MVPTLPLRIFFPKEKSYQWFLTKRAKLRRKKLWEPFLEGCRQSHRFRACFPSDQAFELFLLALKYDPAEPRDARGRWTSRGDGVGPKRQPPVPAKVPNSRAARALASYKPATKAKQDHAEDNEEKLAKMLGGEALPDNEPMDVVVPRPGGEHGIELKTMLDNTRGAITMHGEARRRKRQWSEATGNPIHTVVPDDRDEWEGGAHAHLFSGHKLYYRRGVGSFSVAAMYPVPSYSQLRQLLDTPDAQLPEPAQPKKKEWNNDFFRLPRPRLCG
jgi:hypothetical protein